MMNLPYDLMRFAKVVEKIRNSISRLGLTTDIIGGFPGETPRHFQESLEFIEKMAFSRIHIFPYSRRKNTPAAAFPCQIPLREKHERSKILEKLWKMSALKFHESFVGNSVEVLWETLQNGVWRGYSREYLPCRKNSFAPGLQNSLIVEKVKSALADFVWVES